LLVSFQVDPSSDSEDGKKSRFTRKHVIIAVTCAVITAMVITGVIVGVKFFLDSTTEIVKVYNRLAAITAPTIGRTYEGATPAYIVVLLIVHNLRFITCFIITCLLQHAYCNSVTNRYNAHLQ